MTSSSLASTISFLRNARSFSSSILARFSSSSPLAWSLIFSTSRSALAMTSSSSRPFLSFVRCFRRVTLPLLRASISAFMRSISSERAIASILAVSSSWSLNVKSSSAFFSTMSRICFSPASFLDFSILVFSSSLTMRIVESTSTVPRIPAE